MHTQTAACGLFKNVHPACVRYSCLTITALGIMQRCAVPIKLCLFLDYASKFRMGALASKEMLRRNSHKMEALKYSNALERNLQIRMKAEVIFLFIQPSPLARCNAVHTWLFCNCIAIWAMIVLVIKICLADFSYSKLSSKSVFPLMAS